MGPPGMKQFAKSLALVKLVPEHYWRTDFANFRMPDLAGGIYTVTQIISLEISLSPGDQPQMFDNHLLIG